MHVPAILQQQCCASPVRGVGKRGAGRWFLSLGSLSGGEEGSGGGESCVSELVPSPCDAAFCRRVVREEHMFPAHLL